MNNRLKPEEMFVVIPSKYLESLLAIMTSVPDARAVLEATKPEDSDYWKKRERAKQAKGEINQSNEEDSLPDCSLPVTKATAEAQSLCVSGTPTQLPAAIAAVIPGTTS